MDFGTRGIATRRSVLPREYIRQTRNQNVRAAVEASLYSNTEVAVHGARMALTRAKLPPSAIGLVIVSSCSPELTIPVEACQIAAEQFVHQHSANLTMLRSVCERM